MIYGKEKKNRYFKVVMRVGLEPLPVVNQRGKDDDAKHEEEDQKSQLFGRCFESVNLHPKIDDEKGPLYSPNAYCYEIALHTRILSPGEWRVNLNRRRIRMMEKNSRISALST